ncbi:SPFH domain-containing protein [Streptomyces sp. NPDC088246]|uniref:SPFH domain-containing protein n=1 Tax=Streptomyces sp. NPDC088246 TaxID=3365842 RepID=UPI0037F32553
MGSTVSDSSGAPENAGEREGKREQGEMPVRVWGPDQVKARDGAGGPGEETALGPGGGAGSAGSGSALGPGSGAGSGSALGPGSGARSGVASGSGAAPDAEPGAGPDSVVDLVLDLVPGEDVDSATLGATSASVSVPAVGTAPVPDAAPVPALTDHRTGPGSAAPSPPLPPSPSTSRAVPDTVFDSRPVAGGDGAEQSGDAPGRTGRRHAVIANERTATIPVDQLFRENPEHTDAAALPADVMWRGADGDQPAAGVRRTPVTRGPQVQPSTRPAPAGDPRLAERPGPALPGWVALLAGLAGIVAGGAALWWAGVLPAAALARFGIGSRPYDGIGSGVWAALAVLVMVVIFALGGLGRGRVGYAWVLTLFGGYRGSVRRTGLMWISPLLLRRRVDVRLRHWRSEPLPAVDANGTALRVVVLVVWRIRDTARATLGVADHEAYLREQVEAAMARVLSQLPADAFHEDAHTLRNAEAVGDALTRMLKADCEPVGIEVYSAQPTGIEYAPEIAAAMQRRRIAAIDAKHRDSVLTSVVDAVDDTVNRLTARGLVELDDYERKALVKDLTVAFYTGRSGGEGA